MQKEEYLCCQQSVPGQIICVEVILVLMKLRLNRQMQDLAYQFHVSVGTICFRWIKAMDTRLHRLILWPERDALIKTMPACFEGSFGKKWQSLLIT